MISNFFKKAEIIIAIYILVILGYSVITGIELRQIIDVDFWILSYLISLTTPSIFNQNKDEKTEQE